MANRESQSPWKDFLVQMKARGLHGVEFIVADDHAGLRAAIREAVPEAAYQRCYVHFLRNALDHLPRKTPRRLPAGIALALRSQRSRRSESRPRRLAHQVAWSIRKAHRLVDEIIEETFTCYRLPRQHHKHLKSSNMLERLNEEIKRRTYVVRIFTNAESCLRLSAGLSHRNA
jgi:putative transposase